MAAHSETVQAGQTLLKQMSQQVKQHRALAVKADVLDSSVSFDGVEAEIAVAARGLKVCTNCHHTRAETVSISTE